MHRLQKHVVHVLLPANIKVSVSVSLILYMCVVYAATALGMRVRMRSGHVIRTCAIIARNPTGRKLRFVPLFGRTARTQSRRKNRCVKNPAGSELNITRRHVSSRTTSRMSETYTNSRHVLAVNHGAQCAVFGCFVGCTLLRAIECEGFHQDQTHTHKQNALCAVNYCKTQPAQTQPLSMSFSLCSSYA